MNIVNMSIAVKDLIKYRHIEEFIKDNTEFNQLSVTFKNAGACTGHAEASFFMKDIIDGMYLQLLLFLKEELKNKKAVAIQALRNELDSDL